MINEGVWVVMVGAAVLLSLGCGDDASDGNGGSSATGGTSAGGAGGAGGAGSGGSGGGGASSSGPCSTTACADMEPNAACETCIEDECAAEVAACAADATEATEGCIGCAEILGPGSWDDGCADAKNLFLDILVCLCGDDTTPGKCD
jgi:hypothetical protein